jgi:hypothetical protein
MHCARAARVRGFDSLPSLSDARFIRIKKAEVSKRQYSSKAKGSNMGSNVRDFVAAKNTVRLYTAAVHLDLASVRGHVRADG